MAATITITADVIAFLEDRRIFCSEQKNGEPRRWQVGKKIKVSKSIEVEPYVTFRDGMRIMPFGAYSYTGTAFDADISVGRYCSIAPNVRIGGYNHPHAAVTTSLIACDDRIRWVREAHHDQGLEEFSFVPNPQKPLPTIGNDVWIGAFATIAKGIHIGDGAVVAGGANVTRDVPPYAIVGGNKAELLKWRFPEEIRQAMMELKWWQYRFADIAHLDFNDPAAFVDGLRRLAPELEPWRPRKTNVYKELSALRSVHP